MIFSFQSCALGTSLIVCFSEVKAEGRKLEDASSVFSSKLTHLYAFATSSEQKNVRSLPISVCFLSCTSASLSASKLSLGVAGAFFSC